MTYNFICDVLRGAGVENYTFDAALLVERFCGVSRERLIFSKDIDFDSPELERAVELRKKRYPLQYILGEWTFCGDTYAVGEGCLIPRQETELTVLTAARLLPQNAKFVDLGTGSGCITVSLLKRRADCSAVAVDISDDALGFARKNAEKNSVSERVRFIKADMLDDSAPDIVIPDGKVDAVISNPPYIRSDEVKTLAPELAFEPKSALDGGGDGLDFYRAIIKNFSKKLTDDGLFIFEIGFDEGGALAELAAQSGFDCKIEKDLAALDRTVILRRKK